MILNEQSSYEMKYLIFLVISICACLAGIIILLMKNQETIKTKAMEKDPEESYEESEMEELRQLLLKLLAEEGEKNIS